MKEIDEYYIIEVEFRINSLCMRLICYTAGCLYDNLFCLLLEMRLDEDDI